MPPCSAVRTQRSNAQHAFLFIYRDSSFRRYPRAINIGLFSSAGLSSRCLARQRNLSEYEPLCQQEECSWEHADVALPMANASQLKAVLEQGPNTSFYAPIITLISISLCLQVAVGILLIFIGEKINIAHLAKPSSASLHWQAFVSSRSPCFQARVNNVKSADSEQTLQPSLLDPSCNHCNKAWHQVRVHLVLVLLGVQGRFLFLLWKQDQVRFRFSVISQRHLKEFYR